MPVILPGQTDIYALTDARLSCGRTLETVVSALLGAGVKIIQYREKHMKSGEMLEECRLMRRLTREAGACFIVDDHVDLAILAEADGVHIGQEDFPLPAVRQLVGPKMCIGLSTHSPEQARAAVAVGSVLWICRARSTMSRVVMPTTFTKPSAVMPRTIWSAMCYSSLYAAK